MVFKKFYLDGPVAHGEKMAMFAVLCPVSGRWYTTNRTAFLAWEAAKSTVREEPEGVQSGAAVPDFVREHILGVELKLVEAYSREEGNHNLRGKVGIIRDYIEDVLNDEKSSWDEFWNRKNNLTLGTLRNYQSVVRTYLRWREGLG